MSSGPRVRAVVDTNLLVRGILRKRPDSQAVQLYEAIHRRRFRLVASTYLLDEVRRVLETPELQAVGPTRRAQTLDRAGEEDEHRIPAEAKTHDGLAQGWSCALRSERGLARRIPNRI